MLAAGRPGHRFHVLGPAPPRLVDEAGHVRLAEKHDLNGYERKSDELIRLVESLRLEPRHVFRLRLGDLRYVLAPTLLRSAPTWRVDLDAPGRQVSVDHPMAAPSQRGERS
jgi:hypothetical protein